MFFLIRVAFWLCVVLAFLPTGGSKQNMQAAAPNSDLNAVEAFSAATATVSDMRHFCERQPDACTVGSQAAVAFGQRAQAGAKMVYEFINERLVSQETGSITPHNPPGRASASATKPSQNTLTPSDLVTPWRGPKLSRDGAGKKPV
jgi:hypothetical protein